MHAPATVRGIQSRRNEQVKKLRQALARGERTPEGLLAVDTFHLLEEALSSHLAVRQIFFTAAAETQLRRLLGTADSAPLHRIGAILIDPGHGGKDPGASDTHRFGDRTVTLVEKDVVLATSNVPAEPLPTEWRSEPVMAPGDADYGSARLVLADVVDHERRYRHDAERLASAVMRIYYERDLRQLDSAARREAALTE